MAWCINDLEAWNLILEIKAALHPLHVFLDRTLREIGCTNLLGDATGLTGLNVRSSELIKDKCLAGVDMTKNTEDWASQLNDVLLRLLALQDLLLASVLLGLALLKHLLPELFGLHGLSFLSLREHITLLLLLQLGLLNLFLHLLRGLTSLGADGCV